jgi:hypothetical protein
VRIIWENEGSYEPSSFTPVVEEKEEETVIEEKPADAPKGFWPSSQNR